MCARLHRSCIAVVSLAWGSLWLGCGPLQAQEVTSACADTERLTRLQRRLLAKAEEGVEPLRQYIFITRKIHQLDMLEVEAWMARRRAARAACLALADPTRKQTDADPMQPP